MKLSDQILSASQNGDQDYEAMVIRSKTMERALWEFYYKEAQKTGAPHDMCVDHADKMMELI